jgi:hypothetical protein
MKMLAGLASYCAFVAVLCLGVMAGSAWLLRSDPSIKAEARAPVIPQKILDSIERKKPVPIAVAAPAPTLEPVVPVMQEAPVSLPKLALPPTTREVTERPQRPKKRRSTSTVTAVQAPATPPAAVVSTGRTDFPY